MFICYLLDYEFKFENNFFEIKKKRLHTYSRNFILWVPYFKACYTKYLFKKGKKIINIKFRRKNQIPMIFSYNISIEYLFELNSYAYYP